MTKKEEPMKIEIEDIAKAEKTSDSIDVTDELRNLGKQFAETLQSAWNSEERVRLEGEVREGVKQFADEIDKVLSDVRESNVGQRLREEATTMKSKAEEAELGQKTKTSVASGLGWLSEELAKLAEKFTPKPAEKQPEDIDV